MSTTAAKCLVLQGCWEAMQTGLVFQSPVKIVPPRPEQVFPKHPRNRSGRSLSPALKGLVLIFCASGVLLSTGGHRGGGYGCFKCHFAFRHSACMLKTQDSWISNILCQTRYGKRQNSGLRRLWIEPQNFGISHANERHLALFSL